MVNNTGVGLGPEIPINEAVLVGQAINLANEIVNKGTKQATQQEFINCVFGYTLPMIVAVKEEYVQRKNAMNAFIEEEMNNYPVEQKTEATYYDVPDGVVAAKVVKCNEECKIDMGDLI